MKSYWSLVIFGVVFMAVHVVAFPSDLDPQLTESKTGNLSDSKEHKKKHNNNNRVTQIVTAAPELNRIGIGNNQASQAIGNHGIGNHGIGHGHGHGQQANQIATTGCASGLELTEDADPVVSIKETGETVIPAAGGHHNHNNHNNNNNHHNHNNNHHNTAIPAVAIPEDASVDVEEADNDSDTSSVPVRGKNYLESLHAHSLVRNKRLIDIPGLFGFGHNQYHQQHNYQYQGGCGSHWHWNEGHWAYGHFHPGQWEWRQANCHHHHHDYDHHHHHGK